jgi:transcription elongation GreA/GreB family factor
MGVGGLSWLGYHYSTPQEDTTVKTLAEKTLYRLPAKIAHIEARIKELELDQFSAKITQIEERIKALEARDKAVQNMPTTQIGEKLSSTSTSASSPEEEKSQQLIKTDLAMTKEERLGELSQLKSALAYFSATDKIAAFYIHYEATH